VTRRSPQMVWFFVVLWTFAVMAAACGSDSDGGSGSDGSDDSGGGGSEGSVFVSGSSTVEPISVKVAELFEDVEPGVTVDVEGPGTGDGFKKFCAGESDVSDASRQIKDEEAADCEAAGITFTELKVGIDGIAVMTSPANEAVDCLNFNDLYALVGPESTGFENWSDASDLASALGSSTELPDAPLEISAPGTESGTYDSFIEIVLEGIGEAQAEAGAISEDEAATTRPDYASSSDDTVIISNVAASDSSFGWVGYAFAAEAADVKLLEIDGGDGCVAPTPESIASNEYPVSRDLYIYVNNESAADNAGLAAYIDYYVSEGLGEAVSSVGYVELTDDAKAETEAAWTGR